MDSDTGTVLLAAVLEFDSKRRHCVLKHVLPCTGGIHDLPPD